MKKHIIGLTTVALILVILALAGQLYFSVPVNMMIIAALGAFTVIIASLSGGGAVSLQTSSSDESKEEGSSEEAGKDASEKKNESGTHLLEK